MNLSKPTMVGVGREMVGSWQGVGWEFGYGGLEALAKNFFVMSGFFRIFAF
jgi:hypothetical protein